MDQHEAVDAIYRLIPDMVGQDPAAVLSKYASDRNLAPAQLARLGHVFNTASTNATLAKDRNGTPYLVDVPTMVKDHIKAAGTAKARHSFLDDLGVDLVEVGNQQSFKVASAQTGAFDQEVNRQGSGVPDLWSGREAVASANGSIERPVDKTKRAFWSAVGVVNDVLDVGADALTKYAREASAIARVILADADPHLKLATLKADLSSLDSDTPEALREVVLAKIATCFPEGVSPTEAQPEPFLLARDRTGLVAQFKQATASYKQAASAQATLSAAIERVLDLGPAVSADDQRAPGAIRKLASEVGRYALATGQVKEASAAAKVVQGPWPSPAKHPSADDLSGAAVKAMEDAELAAKSENPLAVAPSMARAGLYGVLQARRTAGDLVFRDVPAALREFTRHGTAGQLLEETAKGNKERAEGRAMDRSQIEQDTRSMAALQKLMLTDEILSRKDPGEVFEAFKTIRAASPEVASDPSLLRLMLRHATETQGVDIDSASAARKFAPPSASGPRPESKRD